jgi:ribonuclease BN (tRNA processing enzyme)
MSVHSLTCFGVGDGRPGADRNHSSFLYRFGEASFLLDCGEPLSRSYKASGLSFDLPDRIVISHLHCDHIGGFFMFIQGLWLERRTRPLTVHMPEYAIAPVRKMLESAMIFDELLHFKLKFQALKRSAPVQFKGVRVTPFLNTHLETLRQRFQKKYRHTFESFSFLIESRECRVAHSADLGAPEDLEPLLKKPVDLLVCELAHFRAEDLFRYLQGRSIGKLVLIHLGAEYWTDRARVRRLGRQMLGGIPLQIAQGRHTIPL